MGFTLMMWHDHLLRVVLKSTVVGRIDLGFLQPQWKSLSE